MKPGWTKAVCSALFLLCNVHCKAQVELSAGPVLSLSQYILASGKMEGVSALNPSPGLSVGLNYNPKELQFFPSCRFSFGQIELPMQQNGIDAGALTYRYFSFMVNGIYTIKVREKRHLVLYSGIGLLYLKEESIPYFSSMSSSSSFSKSVAIISIDSITNALHIFPSANVGIEYKGNSSKKFCLSLGFNIQYTRLIAGRNNYYLYVADAKGTTYYHQQLSLTGNLFQPSFYLLINYKPGKKKSSWYL